MIITRTPFRMSFLGGGSDLAQFYERSPGAVLSVSLNKYMYLSTHGYFEGDQLRVKYSKTETVRSVAEVQHPIVRVCLERFGIQGGVEISSNADIPSGTGLGSSSSFTVGLLHNLHTRAGRFATKERLASEASEIEIDVLREPIGKQDQYAAAYGGLNVFRFLPTGEVATERVALPAERLRDFRSHLLLFYTGVQRATSSVLNEQRANLQNEQAKFAALQRMVEMVEPGRDALHGAQWREFGRILDESWRLKKSLASKISDSGIDTLYDAAMRAGAWGGKLLGAGGGGFLLIMCEPGLSSRIKQELAELRLVPFDFDREGSKVLHADFEDLEAASV